MDQGTEWHEARLSAARDVARNIRLFEIQPARRLAAPAPGSHIMIEMPIGNRIETRSYSTIGPFDDGIVRIAVKRLAQSRGGSAWMWQLAAGAAMRITAPRNHFPLLHHDGAYLLVAGGIGVTPIAGMAMALAATGARVRLLYACQSREDVAFGAELSAALGERLSVMLDSQGQRIDFDAQIAGLDADAELYVCGPLGMLQAARQAWARAQRPADRLRFETFGSSLDTGAQPFRVNIPRLGRELTVLANQTMLEALEAAGVAMIADCRRGECGLCALPILAFDGAVDHRDVFFSDAEKRSNARLCTCVSRLAGGSITIDTADRLA